MVTADRLSRARAGDGAAFGELAGSCRRELQVHCYRMLGSFARPVAVRLRSDR
jgi:RNA polymerase sigma-70 factor (ECF subfamily)